MRVAGMLQSIGLLNDAGEIILERQWGPMEASHVTSHVTALLKTSTLSDSSPITTSSTGDAKYCFRIVSGGIVLVGCCEREVPALLVLEFLRCIASTLSSYLGSVPLSEELIRENFILVYELLDEMVDAGLPAVTEPNVLEEIVPPPRGLSQVVNAIITGGAPGIAIGASLAQSGLANAGILGGGASPGARPRDAAGMLPAGMFGPTPWRRAGVEHMVNEIYIDVEEEVSATLRADGSIVHGLVHGSIKVTSRLSGTPEVHLSVARGTDLLSHALMHPCVRMAPFLRDRSLCFVPPDGVFELCRFVVPCQPANHGSSAAAFNSVDHAGNSAGSSGDAGFTDAGWDVGTRGVADLPLYVRPKISYGTLGGSVSIMVGHRHGRPAPQEGKQVLPEGGHPPLRQMPALENVAVTLHFPPSLKSCDVSATHGGVSMDSDSRACCWQLGLLPLDAVACLQGELQVDPTKASPLQRPSLQLHFSVIGRPSSGIEVEKLTVLNVPYKPVKAIRFVTRAASIDIRTS